jgi:hypothetical protein
MWERKRYDGFKLWDTGRGILVFWINVNALLNFKKPPWHESASKLYRPSNRHLSVNSVSAFADRRCCVVSVTVPLGRNLGIRDCSHYFFFQVAPQLYSRGWVDPVPDPLLLKKNLVAPGIEARPLDLWPGNLTTRPQWQWMSMYNLKKYIIEVLTARELEVKLSYDRRSVAQPILVSGSHLELMTRFFFQSWQLRVSWYGAPSLTRGWIYSTLVNCFWALPEHSLSGPSPAETMTIFYCLIWDSPNLEGQVPKFISPRNRVAQLYPRALDSLFVASYDSQGYGGGILTRLHASKQENLILTNLSQSRTQSYITTDGQSASPSCCQASGTSDQFFPFPLWLFLDSCGSADVGLPLWREVGFIVFSFCLSSPAQPFSDLSPTELMSKFYCLYF